MQRLWITAPIAESTSEILIGRGFPDPLLPVRQTRTATAILTQPGAVTVAERVQALVPKGLVRTLPDRDEAKAMGVAESTYGWLAENGIGRHDTVLGVGGGAVTDLAGFVAATWHRGVEAVLVPTTLLGAVDAAIGGKTGINLAGKNLVGAFHLPSRVVIDLEILERTPPDLRLEGLAEALKAGLIADADLVEVFVRGGAQAPLEDVVARAVAVKVNVVNSDYREDGLRAILNFGHTIGHGVEMATRLPHGMAVAVGMVAAGAVSARRYGFPADWLRGLIAGLGMPTEVPRVSRQEILGYVGRDKKRTDAGLRMVLLRKVGDPVLATVDDDDINSGLDAIGAGIH
ncbi:MAG: 3-dehydroquinate synthase [Acidimicrobiia bacterium]